jgi:RNA polymerase sigma-70 factor, ECF subfamily
MELSGEYAAQAAPLRPLAGFIPKTFDRATPLADQQLIIAAQSGCRTAFNEIWNLYSGRVYRTILGITQNPQDAEDALQESFLRAFLALESFEGRSSFYSWLTRIGINSALGMLRKRRSRPEGSVILTSLQGEEGAHEELRDRALNPEQIFDQQQQQARLMRAVRRLPSNLRETMQTRIAEDCSVKELAHRLNISQTAAKSRLHRASRRLTTALTAGLGSRATRS